MTDLLAKDLWPGMYVGMPDPEGVLCSTRSQILAVKISELRERSVENSNDVTSKTQVWVRYVDTACLGTYKERWFKPTDKLDRLFGPKFEANTQWPKV